MLKWYAVLREKVCKQMIVKLIKILLITFRTPKRIKSQHIFIVLSIGRYNILLITDLLSFITFINELLNENYAKKELSI